MSDSESKSNDEKEIAMSRDVVDCILGDAFFGEDADIAEGSAAMSDGEVVSPGEIMRYLMGQNPAFESQIQASPRCRAMVDEWRQTIADPSGRAPGSASTAGGDVEGVRVTPGDFAELFRRRTVEIAMPLSVAAEEGALWEEKVGQATITFLASPLRSDLAIRVWVEDEHQEDFADAVCVVRLVGRQERVALFSGETPVFCGVFHDDLLELKLEVAWERVEDLSLDALNAIRWSSRRLRDPRSQARYDSLIEAGRREADGV